MVYHSLVFFAANLRFLAEEASSRVAWLWTFFFFGGKVRWVIVFKRF